MTPVDDTTPALDLDGWEALAAQATPGPWLALGGIHSDHGVWHDYSYQRHQVAERMVTQDAAFIAAARDAVPALIAEVRRLTEDWQFQHSTANDLFVALDEARAALAAAEQENEAWRRFSRWSCTRDHRTYPCGDCDGCRGLAGGSLGAVHGAFDRLAAAEARITNATALCDVRGLEREALIEHLRRALTGDGK